MGAESETVESAQVLANENEMESRADSTGTNKPVALAGDGRRMSVDQQADAIPETHKPGAFTNEKLGEGRAADAIPETHKPGAFTNELGKGRTDDASVVDDRSTDSLIPQVAKSVRSTDEEKVVYDGEESSKQIAAETTNDARVGRASSAVSDSSDVTSGRKTNSRTPRTEQRELLNGMLNDDEVARTLEAASEKLQAAQRNRNKRRRPRSILRVFKFLHPKRLFFRIRDCYLSTCMMAAEKADFADVVAGRPRSSFGNSRMISRTMSARHEEEEMLQASISRQISAAVSRNSSASETPLRLSMTRNTSKGVTGMPRNPSGKVSIPLVRNASAGQAVGLPRNTSSGSAGLPRNASTGMTGFDRSNSVRAPGLARSSSKRAPSSAGKIPFVKSHAKKSSDSNLFSAGRDTYLQKKQS